MWAPLKKKWLNSLLRSASPRLTWAIYPQAVDCNSSAARSWDTTSSDLTPPTASGNAVSLKCRPHCRPKGTSHRTPMQTTAASIEEHKQLKRVFLTWTPPHSSVPPVQIDG